MPFSLNRRFPTVILAALFAVVPVISVRAEETPRFASAEAKELWIKGSDQILAGDFKAGVRTIEQVQEAEPGTQGVQSALNWMRDLQKLEKDRAAYRQAMYDHYVAKVHEYVNEAREGKPAQSDEAKVSTQENKRKTLTEGEEKVPVDGGHVYIKPRLSEKEKAASKDDSDDSEQADEVDELGDEEALDDDAEEFRYRWSRALFKAHDAMLILDDEEKFRSEPWLPEIVENTRQEIEISKNKNEWRDALTIYSVLQSIYPDNKEYKQGFDFCSKRAHLEFVYGDAKKTTWRIDLDGVTADALKEILVRIDDDYVEEPQLRKLCRDGVEHLRILAETESIAKTFPTLAERDLVARFVNRLDGQLKRQVDGSRRFSSRTLKDVFDSILEANAETIRLPEEVVVDEFVAGMLEPLDEFTSVIWPTEVAEFNKQTRGEFVGVGIQITQEIGKPVRVESPLEDSPAYNAGIKPGDFILAVEGKNTTKMTITEAVRNITGEPGTTVVLTIKDGTTKEVRDVELLRDRIILRTVRGNLRDDNKPTGWDFTVDPDLGIAYVRVSGFMDKTVRDLEKALAQLDDENCRGIILDLRFNPGGLLNAARDMCDLFLPEDAPIVRTKGRDRGQNMVLRAAGRRNRHRHVPMIVLVNEYSASASEIVAGALAGLKEACIIGARTFGKGSVQNLIPILDAQAYLKLTTAHYYVPDADIPGNDPWYLLHRKEGAKSWGVEPHIVVNTIPHETTKILRLRRERDLLRGKGQAGNIPKEVLERRKTGSKEEKLPDDPNPDVDPQFVTALSVMRMKLMSDQPWALAPRAKRTALSVATMPKEASPTQK
ncbi:MAG TPA: S41 family peptidase [Phycisphaerae bacterium]|nr:S41 family peptidase [Phycisphaerae bacterium]